MIEFSFQTWYEMYWHEIFTYLNVKFDLRAVLEEIIIS